VFRDRSKFSRHLLLISCSLPKIHQINEDDDDDEDEMIRGRSVVKNAFLSTSVL
jgi:hypothetical protein